MMNSFSKSAQICTVIYIFLFQLYTNCFAETVIFKEGVKNTVSGDVFQGTEDTYISGLVISNMANESDQNFGKREELFLGRNVRFGLFGPRRVLIRYDLSEFSRHYLRINSITFRFYPKSVYFYGNTSCQFNVYQLTESNGNWIEGTGVSAEYGDPPDSGMTTWNQKIQEEYNWAGEIGASTPGTDYLDAPIATNTFTKSTGTGLENPFDITIQGQSAQDLIEKWTTGGSNGLTLISNDDTHHSDSQWIRFWSSDAEDALLRPELIIDYIPIEPGDIDANGIVELEDAINSLQIIAGFKPASDIHIQADVNGDSSIGIAETIYIIQTVAETISP